MHPQWRDFLSARGARTDSDDTVAWPDRGESGDCILADLSHLGLIAVRGADAETFLQGQITNDIRQLSPGHTQMAAHCSHKGRMLAIFRVMRLADGVYLQLPRERTLELIRRLRPFLLRAQATLEDASDELVRIGAAGDCLPRLLAGLGLPLPAQDGEIARADGEVFVLRLPGPVPRVELIGPVGSLPGIWDGLAAEARPAGADAWALLDIRAGLPTVYSATADALVPQMANLHLVDGVSFKKGCYTGQEVVARMQYLGTLKRRMYLAETESEVPPRPGDELFAPGSDSGQGAGRVVDARPAGDGRWALLAVVEIAAAEGGEVRLGESGPLLRLSPPPYGFQPEPVADASSRA